MKPSRARIVRPHPLPSYYTTGFSPSISAVAAKRGIHTKPNAWDQAAALQVFRGGEKLDPGANYFVLMFDQMGLPTRFSCEGHPDGFYVTFFAPYAKALAINRVGYFSVEIERNEAANYWSIRQHMTDKNERQFVDGFRWAAAAWEKAFGPLDFSSVRLVM